MKDSINRQDVIDAKQEFRNPKVVRSTETRTAYDRAYANGWNDCNSAWINIINALPSAERKGKWIKTRYWTEGCGMGETYGYYYKCSRCEKEVKGNYPSCGYDYCPHCGARMAKNGE